MGVDNQPSHPSRHTSTSNHHTDPPPRLLGKVSAGLERWGCSRGCKSPTVPDSQFSRELPMRDPWEGVPLTARFKGSAMGEDSSTAKTLTVVSKRNIKTGHLQRAPEGFSGFSCWRPEERGHLQPLLMSKPFDSFLTAHRRATLAVPCRISFPCSRTWILCSITTTASRVSSSDPIWGANAATANVSALGLWFSICSYRD